MHEHAEVSNNTSRRKSQKKKTKKLNNWVFELLEWSLNVIVVGGQSLGVNFVSVVGYFREKKSTESREQML